MKLTKSFWIKIEPLTHLLGNKHLAVGAAVCWLKYASQKTTPVTESEWLSQGFPTELVPLFALRTAEGYEIARSPDEVRLSNIRSEAGKFAHFGTKRSKTSKTKQNVANAKTQEVKTNEFISFYIKQFKLRYGAAPPIQGKDTGIAKRLLKEFGLERLTLLLDAYFAMPDAYVLKAKHPLNLFAIKMNEVVVFAETGKFTTQRDARMQDSISTVHSQIERIKRGEL